MLPLKRTYKTSDGGLVDLTQRMLTGATRDITELTNFGYTPAMLDDIEAKKVAFAQLPTDVEQSALMAETTLAKTNKRTEATNYVMVEIMSRVKLKYTDESHPTYKRFGVSNIHNETDGNFLILLYRVHRQANALQATIGHGLTAAHVAQVNTFATQFLDLWKVQDEAIDERDRAVQTRVESGNSLYKDVAQLGDLGKRIWLNVNESKYNDYVLYPASAEPPAQTVVETDVAATSVVNLSVTGITPASQSTYQNTGAVKLHVYYSALPAQQPQPGDTVIDLEPGTDWSGTAAQTGYEEGVREYLNVFNNGVALGHIIVTVLE